MFITAAFREAFAEDPRPEDIRKLCYVQGGRECLDAFLIKDPQACAEKLRKDTQFRLEACDKTIWNNPDKMNACVKRELIKYCNGIL